MTTRIRIAGLVAFAALAAAAPAEATSETTNCAGLQAALTQAVAGDTITLDQLCTGTNSGAADGEFTLPSNAAFTLTGQPGSGAGFDGTGLTGALLYGPSAGGTALGANFTLSSLTVQNAGNGSNGAVYLRAESLGGITIQSMDFTDNTGLGALVIDDDFCPSPDTATSPFTLAGSTFTGNSVTNTTGYAVGGGAGIFPGCNDASRAVSVTDNVFTSNDVSSGETSSDFWGALGGGLAVLDEANESEPLTQSGNTFTDNFVASSAAQPTAFYGGAGEWIQGMNLTSTDDAFIGNTAVGATGSGWTYGAGLGIVNSSCTNTTHTVGVATNLVAAGNTITGGTAADVNGAGVYTGCDQGVGSDLTLQDSTVSGNSSVAGGVAGIGGEAVDHLILENTIDTGNTGGADVGGFNGTGGSITASYSDACASGAALPGTGNICAPPTLVSATDVHETESSPTIDKGSNSLVPAAVTKDFFGDTRVLAGAISCTAPFPPAIVDIGAAEYVPAAKSCPPPPSPKPLVTTGVDGNQRITVTSPSACTVNTRTLSVTADSATIAASKRTKLKFSSIAFYIDRGVKHSHRKTTGNGKHKKTVTVITYLPNATAHHVPATLRLSLRGLKSGTHALKVVLSYKETTKNKHGHKTTITVTKALNVKFSVC